MNASRPRFVTTRSGIRIGCAFSSTLAPDEAAPLERPRRPMDREDLIVLWGCLVAAIGLLVFAFLWSHTQ